MNRGIPRTTRRSSRKDHGIPRLTRGPGLTHLKDLPELTELGLGCPTLTDLFANRLPELKQIQQLSLAGSGLTDAGIKALHGLTNLHELDLTGTKVTAAGVAALQQALPKCAIAWDASAELK